jgi:tRNA dimethylallyltransferase
MKGKNVRELPLVVIVGPTASGKTALAVDVAQNVPGGAEIIAADSRTVFREMNIGTAKPTLAERGGVPHWGLDLAVPDEPFSVADFQAYARAKIAEIRARGHVPILVGGSGLYIDAIIYDYQLPKLTHEAEINRDKRREIYNKMSVSELQNELRVKNFPLPENAKNPRHLINALLRDGQTSSRRSKILGNTIAVGIDVMLAELNARIAARAKNMLQDGLIDEVRDLVKRYGEHVAPFQSNAYGLAIQLLRGEIATLDELLEKMIIADRRLAKKQRTWWRRHNDIVWLPREDAQKYIMEHLSQAKYY